MTDTNKDYVALAEKYEAWINHSDQANIVNEEDTSAEALIFADLTPAQRTWLSNFINEWEA